MVMCYEFGKLYMNATEFDNCLNIEQWIDIRNLGAIQMHPEKYAGKGSILIF